MARHAEIAGRYLYLEVDGTEYRTYYEEAGSGPTIILQHTAGADGRQWRHLLEDTDLTRRYRLVAHDLPFHGKSVPPTSKEWWTEEYALHQDFFMRFIVAFCDELGYGNDTIYCGCSMGGHLAPDLALHYPGRFRATIAVEGGLATHDDEPFNKYMWHPRCSDELKQALMFTMMSPRSPEPFRREVGWIYAQGAPPVHKGDLVYYLGEHDLTEETAKLIDTSKTAVYVISGDHDWSATPEHCRALADAIPGATYTSMSDMGHFPMSEDPVRFKQYLLGLLDDIESKSMSGSTA